ncbi:MAG TPA: 23S rRNA (adenine(2503)-C(2))-methyltransferase RlmN [Deltaproteobacteria bacterium]|nr:23S rRNA (adenine(2503)-C(2))-methyltransferase RlmN [Deltaproteobacteria bacterium]
MVNLLDLDREQMKELCADKPFRGDQIYSWVYGKGIRDINQMTNLPKDLRENLAQRAHISYPEVVARQVSCDGTEKLVYTLTDGSTIESVLMPEKSHWSICISSQVGCALGCAFCCTARNGYTRNLSPGEILSQVLYPIHTFPERTFRNVVFMGMGEPLLNYDNMLQAVHILTDPCGLQISTRRVTISTSGIVPALSRLGRETAACLAISLNASCDEKRSSLMPINRTYPLSEIMKALREYPLPNRRRITIEYVLLKDYNDSGADARDLIRLLHGLRVKVNLIPFNPWPGCDFQAPDQERVLAFEAQLKNSPFAVMVRREKGRDILAACGQLAGKGKNEGPESY